VAGKYRELQNLIERAVIRSNDGVLPNPLPATEPEQPPRSFRVQQRCAIPNGLDSGTLEGVAG